MQPPVKLMKRSMARVLSFRRILEVLVMIIVSDPKLTQSVFQESPQDTTEYAGFDVEFRCRHTTADAIGWLLNGTSIIFGIDSQLLQRCPGLTVLNLGDQLQNFYVHILIIRAAVECNRTEVQCVAYSFDGQENDGQVPEVSEPAILTVKRIGAVGNLQVLNKNQSYIRLAWHPIVPFNSGNTVTTMIAIITYRVNVIVNNTFTGLLHNQLFETRDTRFVYTPNNGSPCEYYTLSVTPIINVLYEGIEAIIQEIYLFQDLSEATAILSNSIAIGNRIHYTFSVSQYVCSVILSLYHPLSIYYNITPSEIIPRSGEINEVTFAVLLDEFDEKYIYATINLYNAIETRKVEIPPLNTDDIQDVTIQNGNLTVVFLNGSTVAGAFVVLTVADVRTFNFTFEYLTIENSPLSNTAEVTLPYNNINESSSLIHSVYEIESTGLLKESSSLMPVKTLPWSQTMTDNNNVMDDSESGLELQVSSPTSNSIQFDCKSFKPEVIRGCSAVVHVHNNFQNLILSVNNSVTNDVTHSLKVQLQNNESEFYYYAVFPVTSKGIIGSNAVKGKIRFNDNGNTVSNNQLPQVIIIVTVIAASIVIISVMTIILLYKFYNRVRGPITSTSKRREGGNGIHERIKYPGNVSNLIPSNDSPDHVVYASTGAVKLHYQDEAQPEENSAKSTKNTQYNTILKGMKNYESEFYTAANRTANVPFLDHKLLECDSNGLEYTNECHDITLRVPEGAVEIGKKIHFEFAVAMYGPYIFPENTQPTSPILWLCILEKDVKLRKPFLVILPHYLTGLSNDMVEQYHAGFAKADHNDYTWEGKQMWYHFHLCHDIKPLFARSGSKGYGVLISNHCCYYCLLAEKTPELAMKAGYMLVRVESILAPHQYEIYFCAIFFLNTCVQNLKKQFPEEDGYHMYCCEFKFNPADSETGPYIRMAVDDSQFIGADRVIVARQPVTAMIRATEINFWQEKDIDVEKMHLRHKLKTYPPRIQMTVRLKTMDDIKLPVTFEGCSTDSQLNMELTFPIVSRNSIPSSPTSSSSSNRMLPQSHKILCDKQFSTIFRELSDVAEHWKSIGILLEIPYPKLNVISANQSGVYERLQEMLHIWLRQVTLPTWKDLAEAVDVFDPKKADEIRRRSVEPQHYVLETEV